MGIHRLPDRIVRRTLERPAYAKAAAWQAEKCRMVKWRKRCGDASHSKALCAKCIAQGCFISRELLECALPARPCAGVLASLLCPAAQARSH
jgi:hypothetical protein